MRVFIIAFLLLINQPANAFYTECIVGREIMMVNRPDGYPEPRWQPIAAGDKVAIRDTFGKWVFVTYYADEKDHYGWLPQAVFVRCRKMEGTP